MTLVLDDELLAHWTTLFNMAPRADRVKITEQAAGELQCSTDTFRRRAREAENSSTKSQKRGQHKSKGRAHALADKIISERWLTSARSSVAYIYELYEVWCDDAKGTPQGKITPLSESSFERKIDAITDQDRFHFRRRCKSITMRLSSR
jgi:sRNA-binding protein